MKIFEAKVRVVHIESWSVEAENETQARAMIAAMDDDVQTDETGGETIDWEIESIREYVEA